MEENHKYLKGTFLTHWMFGSACVLRFLVDIAVHSIAYNVSADHLNSKCYRT